ncbi:unnamed protein product, partial [Heterotrigona itama]
PLDFNYQIPFDLKATTEELTHSRRIKDFFSFFFFVCFVNDRKLDSDRQRTLSNILLYRKRKQTNLTKQSAHYLLYTIV